MQLLTVQGHILEEQRRRFPKATGEFSWLLSGITLATKLIGDQVRRAGLTDILGSDGTLYGTTTYGGSADAGTVFHYEPAGNVRFGPGC